MQQIAGTDEYKTGGPREITVKFRTLLSPASVLLASDCLALFACYALAFVLRLILPGGSMSLPIYVNALPWLLLFPPLYYSLGLYPGTFLRRTEELKCLSIATSIGFLCIVFFTFILKESHAYSRIALTLAWLFSLGAVPMFRSQARKRFRHFHWWGVPCVLFGNAGRLLTLCTAFKQMQIKGVRPTVVVLDENAPRPDLAPCLGPADTVLVKRISLKDTEAAKKSLERVTNHLPKAYAVVSFDSAYAEERQAWLDIIDQCFQKIIIIPDMAVGGRFWYKAVAIGRLSGILVLQNLLDTRRMFLKRFMDILLTFLVGIVAFPLFFCLGVAVMVDSRGPILFRQQRIGKGGKQFTIYKFRTMVVNGDEILEQYLAENPEARQEWDETQKLKYDPRTTRVGNFLRRTSLDELPQLINVFKGDMSLVGPRPIVDDEVARYGKGYGIYTRVRPGITGLWQVSGRNNLPYSERVWLDHHYVCNWSVWMDIMIIAKTLPEVWRGSGAY